MINSLEHPTSHPVPEGASRLGPAHALEVFFCNDLMTVGLVWAEVIGDIHSIPHFSPIQLCARCIASESAESRGT